MTTKTLRAALAAMIALSAGAAVAADSPWPPLDSKMLAVKTPDAKQKDAAALEPDPAYAKVCDAFGEGFSYLPGTDTCVKVSGYIKFGTSIHGGSSSRSNGSHDQ